MGIRLGLDIGANSIGWAVVDAEAQQVMDMGVRVFPAGVNQYNTNKEETKNQSRRAARGLRRQYARRRWRKVKLVEFLNRFGLTPFTSTDLNHWKKSRDLESKPHLRDWFMRNPYDLRAAALTRKLEPHELGRVFYHMVQRRGFLSNRKSGGSEESTIFEGKKETGTVGIAQVRNALKGEPTLGVYLSKIDPHEERIRNRYTERKMYVEEAKAILTAQSRHHAFINEAFVSELLGKDTQKNMDGVLFFQRPLRSARHLLGKCPFEPSKPRAPITCFDFEAFRVWSWVNTVEYMGEPLRLDQREVLAEILFTTSDKTSFGGMKKKLGYAKKDEFFNYADDDKIPGARVTAAFRKAFGAEWAEWPDAKKELIWHDVINATDDEWLSKRLLEHWSLDPKQTEILMGLRFKHDYGSLSRKALRNILPFVEAGYRYDQAVLLGGVRNAFGPKWKDLADPFEVIDTVRSFKRSVEAGTQLDQIRSYLASTFGLSDAELKRLYHHSQTDEVEELVDVLPKPDPVRNPVVMQALHEVRKLVNVLLERFGRFDDIHLELARDLGKSARERSEDRKYQKQNEDYNHQLRKRLLEYGQPDSYDFRLKLKLYEELKDKMCPYTGKAIRLSESSTATELGLFSGQVQIEHIIPYSRSLTNAFGNLTLCDADVNRQKGNKTPFEFYSEQGTWEDAKLRARNALPYRKYQRFIKTELEEDPINRMLNDTRYISREMHRYLKKVCANVVPVNGALTADVRHHWGLNTILNEEDAKNRDDHRHHAIDALVVALTTRGMVKAASDWNKYNRDRGERRIPAPWEGLRDQVRAVTDAILVSHKKVNRVLTRKESVTKRFGKVHRNHGLAARGALHKESIYGKRRSPDGEVGYHLRKPLSSITKVKQLHKVVDLAVRNSMLGVMRDKGLTTDMKADIPANTFTYFDESGKLRTNVYLASRNGMRLPVFKVRVKEDLSNAVELSDGRRQHVNPRNNHHVALYRSPEGELSEECVTFWDVVERIKQGRPAIAPVNAEGHALEETLQINDLFLIGYEGDIETARLHYLLPHLYRVQKLSTCDYWFRTHYASTLKNDEGEYVAIWSMKAWDQRRPRKVWMTVDGRIEPYRR